MLQRRREGFLTEIKAVWEDWFENQVVFPQSRYSKIQFNEKLTMPNYSYSRLDTFKQCPRKYAYRYIEKPEIEKQPTIEAHLGTVCHETIQQIYKDLRLSKLMKQEEVFSFYEDLWDRSKSSNLRIVRDRYTEKNYRETGRGYVKTFYETNYPFNDGKTIGIEKNVQIRLSSDVVLTGYIDLLVDHGNGRYEIIDYKTQRVFPDLDDIEQNWQLPLYHIGLLEMFSDVKDIACSWHYLAHNKIITLKKTAQDLETIKKSVLELIRQVEETRIFDPRVSTLCEWCDYEIICPARKHFVETENLPPELFAKEDGVKLVNAYVETVEKIAGEKAKFEALKEKIYNYGIQHGVSIVRGSQNQIKISTKTDAVDLPTKKDNPSGNRAIIDALKKHGLWERYSQLNSWELKEAIEKNQLPQPVMDEIRPYVQRENSWRVTSSKLKDWE